MGGGPTAWNGTAANHIVFGAYGSGAKPRLLGSVDKSSLSGWTLDGGNIWKTTAKFRCDVGNLIFNNEASAGWKRWTKDLLGSQGDFWFSRTDSLVYLYSTSNPGTYYTHIEAALKTPTGGDVDNASHIITVFGESHLTFQNLDLRYCGWIGIHCYGNPSDIITESCDFSWIGGSYGNDSVRAGNAWQTWRGGTDLVVRYCTFNQIYDSGCDVEGVDHPGLDTYKRIRFYYNTIANAHFGFQFMPRETTSGTVVDSIFWENNTIYNIGGEWSYKQRLNFGDTHVGCAAWESSEMGSGTTNYTAGHMYIRNNIFSQGRDNLLYQRFWSPAALANLTMSNNLYYTNPAGVIIMWDRNGYAGQDGSFTNSQFATYQAATGKDAHSFVANPAFISANDFHLQQNSPCKNAGVNVGLSRDFDGTPVGNPPSLGAFELSGSTLPLSPTVALTSAATDITSTGAQLNGSVNPNGASTTYYFVFGPTAGYGSSTPVVSAGSGSSIVNVKATVTGLHPGTVYHYQMVAVANARSISGSDMTFTLRTSPDYGDNSTFDLWQNYPNPFNLGTSIAYVIRQPTEVSLKIYNTLGVEVSNLVSGIQTAGRHVTHWDASRLASGIYFATMMANGAVSTRRMILLK